MTSDTPPTPKTVEDEQVEDHDEPEPNVDFGEEETLQTEQENEVASPPPQDQNDQEVENVSPPPQDQDDNDDDADKKEKSNNASSVNEEEEEALDEFVDNLEGILDVSYSHSIEENTVDESKDKEEDHSHTAAEVEEFCADIEKEEEPEPSVPSISTDDDDDKSEESIEDNSRSKELLEIVDGLTIDAEAGSEQQAESDGANDVFTTPPETPSAKSVNWTNDTKDAMEETQLPTNTEDVQNKSPTKEVDATTNTDNLGDRKIKLRNPYPKPSIPPASRTAEEIIAEHILPIPQIDPPSIIPNEQLSSLIEAARSPSLPRRANAVGALRVLASSQAKMPIKLVRTQGFLDALVYAASHSPEVDAAFGICREEYNAALDARTRSVSLMLLLCQAKENRLRLCQHDGLLQALVKVMEEDTSEARMLACGVVTICAKTKENRQIISETTRLVTVLAKVMRGEFTQRKNVEAGKEGLDDKIVAEEGGVERLLSMDYEDMKELEDQRQKKMQADVDDAANEEEAGSAGDDAMSDGSGSIRSNYGTFDDDDEDEGRSPKDAAQTTEAGMREQNLGKYEEFLLKSRMSACAALLHLSKHCPVSPILCDHDIFIENTLQVGSKFNDPIHTRCLELLCMVTRFPPNTASLARRSGVIDTLLRCGKSKTAEDRKWALRSLQNLTAEPTNKAPLAVASVLGVLRVSAIRKGYEDEQIAAASALVNISTEPSAIVPLTSTPNVVATLVTLAHNSESSKEVCDLACEALANMGLWLQNLAASGLVPDGMPNVPLPTHTSSGWRRWENAAE